MRHSQDCLGAGTPCCYESLAPDDAFVHSAPSPSAAHAGLLAEVREFMEAHDMICVPARHNSPTMRQSFDCLTFDLAAALRDMVREAGRFYHADGSFTEHDPATVIEMRKAAAVKMVAPCHNCGHSCEGLTLPASPSPGAVEVDPCIAAGRHVCGPSPSAVEAAAVEYLVAEKANALAESRHAPTMAASMRLTDAYDALARVLAPWCEDDTCAEYMAGPHYHYDDAGNEYAARRGAAGGT